MAAPAASLQWQWWPRDITRRQIQSLKQLAVFREVLPPIVTASPAGSLEEREIKRYRNQLKQLQIPQFYPPPLLKLIINRVYLTFLEVCHQEGKQKHKSFALQPASRKRTRQSTVARVLQISSITQASTVSSRLRTAELMRGVYPNERYNCRHLIVTVIKKTTKRKAGRWLGPLKGPRQSPQGE